ncbi:MAG: addiction module protein [Bacteroidetes bacterium]|nr:addiction module protein [Bacteroidota bacterium]
MGKLKDKNLDEILKRSMAEKLFVVESLWENIRSEAVKNGTDKEGIEFVNERLEAYKKNPTKIKKWEDIKKGYLKKK